MPELLITLPNGQSFHHSLGSTPALLGREPTCDIHIDDPSTSRSHARISPSAEGHLIEDLGSKNGTLVNGLPATRQTLADGDVITLGAVSIRFSDEFSASARTVVVSDAVEPRRESTQYRTRDQRLDLSHQRLTKLYELTDRLTTLKPSRADLLEDALAICFETLHFERGAIGVKRDNTRLLDWPVVRNLHGAEGELTISRTLLSRALDRGERATFTDDGSQPVDPTISIVQHGIRSAMCVPLMHGDEIMGVIYGDRTSTSTTYDQEDIDFLAAIARQVTIGLINFRLAEEQKKYAQVQYDLGLARRIQTGLFPSDLPAGERLKVAALNEPGNRISGDYYDFMPTDGDSVWLLMADVTGEGMPAALLMANLQAAVRVTIHDSTEPGELLTKWNKLVCENTDDSKFITCQLCRLDPVAGKLSFSCAGHFPPLIVRADSAGPFEPEHEPGVPLGVLEDEAYITTTVPLGSGLTTILAYTDGIIEAMNPDRQQFGHERLFEVVSHAHTVGPQMLVKQVRRAVTQFVAGARQSDDITLLAAQISS